jgi:hypothetical protein
MTVEATEMLINGGRVQKNGQPPGQRLGQPAPVFMEQVEVVLKTQHLYASAAFFCLAPFRQ